MLHMQTGKVKTPLHPAACGSGGCRPDNSAKDKDALPLAFGRLRKISSSCQKP